MCVYIYRYMYVGKVKQKQNMFDVLFIFLPFYPFYIHSVRFKSFLLTYIYIYILYIYIHAYDL